MGSSFIATVGTAAAVADPTDDQHPVRQLRGIWIATVLGIDWPTVGAPAAQQK